MKKLVLLFFAVASFSGVAQAETFTCQATGRFAEAGSPIVDLNWDTPDYEKDLISNDKLKVLVYVDKSTGDDGPHYLGIEVIDTDGSGNVTTRAAKGSLHDMVQYIEITTSTTSTTSIITCLLDKR